MTARRLATVPFFLLTLALLAPTAPVRADDSQPVKLPAVFDKSAPENVADLKAIQEQVRKVLEKVIPCTVGIRIGAAQGSGVIVSKDGYVLTAGHVSGTPGKDCVLVLPDGKTVKGKTLGLNKAIDSGMIKIVEEREWAFVDMGTSTGLKPGTWCIATGHPGGFKAGRSPVVRVGRLLNNSRSAMTSDCTLVGGDSGGPLFDMQGRVIGIHSRIGGTITANVHVPVDTYRDTWDRLAKAESINGGLGAPEPYLGVQGDPDGKGCVIAGVQPASPAEKAKLQANDIILKMDGQKVETFDDLGGLIRKKKPGDEVTLDVRRGEEMLTLKVKLGTKN